MHKEYQKPRKTTSSGKTLSAWDCPLESLQHNISHKANVLSIQGMQANSKTRRKSQITECGTIPVRGPRKCVDPRYMLLWMA
jgi:hypothetical protein